MLPYEPYAGNVWRLVEAQHVVSTMKIVDTMAEQDVLERVLETTKPPVPEDCRHLDYLLSTPFRYGLYPINSRFRRMGETPGVFYGAEDPMTAVAETVWRRRRFFEGSPETPLPKQPGIYTAFSARVCVPLAIDLTQVPMAEDQVKWTDPDDYTACLNLADQVRAEGGEMIRYASVRHPDALPNIAVLTCRSFEDPHPSALQTWHVILRPGRTQVRCEHPPVSAEFEFDATRLRFTAS
ncbi:MAG: RES family NAD+ phosphorylase [Pseudomonadota bacterium]